MNGKAKALRDIWHWYVMNDEYAKHMLSFYWDVANEKPVVQLDNAAFFDQLKTLSIKTVTPLVRDDAQIYAYDIRGITFKTVVFAENKNRVTA